MTLRINDQTAIIALQEEFNSIFPYLKLEFFSKSYSSNGVFERKYLKLKNKKLGEFRNSNNQEVISISPEMTVVDLGQGFKDVYGLGAQVFRKSGKVWLETTFTDGWTLEEQNRQGEELSKNNI